MFDFYRFQIKRNRIKSKYQWFDFLTIDLIRFAIKNRNQINRFDLNLESFRDVIFTKQNCRTLKHLHQECETWNRRHEIVFASIKYELIHLTKNHRRFNMQMKLRIEAIQKTSALYVRILSVQMNNKLKWKSHVRIIQKKIITQMMTLSRFTMFTWKTCFVRARLIY
jgi:hypothetical protein